MKGWCWEEVPPLQNFQFFSIPKFREAYNTNRVLMGQTQQLETALKCCNTVLCGHDIAKVMVHRGVNDFRSPNIGNGLLYLNEQFTLTLDLYISLPFFSSRTAKMGEILSFSWEANAIDRILTNAWCTNEIRLGVTLRWQFSHFIFLCRGTTGGRGETGVLALKHVEVERLPE